MSDSTNDFLVIHDWYIAIITDIYAIYVHEYRPDTVKKHSN